MSKPQSGSVIADELAETELCQTPGQGSPTPRYEPFVDDDRGGDKTRLIKYLSYHPKGVPLVRCVKAILPDSTEERIVDRSYCNTDYKFVSRFFERSEYVALESETGEKLARPQPAAFHLTLSSKFPTPHTRTYPKDRAKACLYGFHDLNDVKDARRIAKDFARYLDSIHGKRLMLQEQQQNDLRLTLPYHTRFNNEHRKREQWARYNNAWAAADDKYEKGVMLTLTTDPKRHASIGEMLDSLMDAWQQLLETLNQKYAGEPRLDFMRALEFGGSDKSNHVGLPHLHVCVFGVPFIAHSWLSNYWNQKHAEIVDVQSINKRGADSWTIQTGRHEGKSVAGYLGKYLSKTFETIGDDPDELHEAIDSWEEVGNWRNSQIWKLALYWASGRQFWDCSHDLKDSNANVDRLEEISGLGETKLQRLADAGIHTLSDVRLASESDIGRIEGISQNFAEKLKNIVGEPSDFDIYNFVFVGAATYQKMPGHWSMDAKHYGITSAG